ncbi:putative ferric-chelate reductase (NADH) [Helianthus annuus]|uniref:Ferric-chelate reductase (NADH) n=1 Tax=Helianthus annuus TaxID=4232 RepID=A0A9K3I5K8_HELAN|nr:putative ferric-chelate reductase (NADH) [Helianthus annuus]
MIITNPVVDLLRSRFGSLHTYILVGGNILVYTAPILLIATLGCIYLHLENKPSYHPSNQRSNIHLMGLLERPVIVRGPLGIVTWKELLFLSMFIGLLVWSTSAYIHAMFATITTQSASKMKVKVWEVKLDSMALMLGLVGNICLAFLFFPVTRGSPLLRLIGLTSESSIKYHIWVGHVTMVLFTAHGLCYTLFWAKTHQISQMLKWEKIGISNVAGEVGLLTGLGIWLTSVPYIRRNVFELFYYTHHLYILFVVFFILHVGFSYCWITLPGFFLFLINRMLRFLQSHQKVRLVSARVLPCRALELNFSKTPGVNYNPTSSIFVNVPKISKLQWHPFTITSSSNLEPEKLSVVIKCEGNWSQKLYEELSLPSTNHLQVSVEGPYGPATTHFHKYETLVMFSGGSGITPFISIIRELVHMANDPNSTNKTPQVILVPAFKTSLDLGILDLLLPVTGTSHDISRLRLKIQAYVTQESGPPKPATENQQAYRTVWFKPSTLDAPISAILGRNSWLSLGMIIVWFSVTSLTVVAVVTQFYIYPNDRNTNMIYSYTVRSVLNMLIICMSIAITVIIAFLWNKKRNSAEMRQIRVTDGPTPLTSPGMSSWYYSADRELESLPYKSFAGCITVHCGERPDFKKILMEIGGSNIGVLASGPKKMRQDVAAICSSGISKNFRFESISFSW